MFLPQPVSGDHGARVLYSDMLALGDERVVQELQTGNTDAFAVIFKRYQRLVHVTALQILRDASEAEDVTQSVFWRFTGKRDNLTLAEALLKCGFCNTRIAAVLIAGIT